MTRTAMLRLAVGMTVAGLPLAAALAAPLSSDTTQPGPRFRVSGVPCVVSSDPRARVERVRDLVFGRCGRAAPDAAGGAALTDERVGAGPGPGDVRPMPRTVQWDDVDPRVTVRRPSAPAPTAASDAKDVETRSCGPVPFAALSQDFDPRTAGGRDPLLTASLHARLRRGPSIASAPGVQGGCS